MHYPPEVRANALKAARDAATDYRGDALPQIVDAVLEVVAKWDNTREDEYFKPFKTFLNDMRDEFTPPHRSSGRRRLVGRLARRRPPDQDGGSRAGAR